MTYFDITWKTAGQQGEGIETLSELFASAIVQAGYEVYGFRQFSSRIKGGHTSYKLRISQTNIATVHQSCDILIGFDAETLTQDLPELNNDGLLLLESKLGLPENPPRNILLMPFTALAESCGGAIYKNVVALGATVALFNLDLTHFTNTLIEIFAKKTTLIQENNLKALNLGYEYIKTQNHEFYAFVKLPDSSPNPNKQFLLGNEAVAMGALAAGVKLMSAYPITPSSEIMEYLAQQLPNQGGQMLQTEDEISACTMAIGAGYAGVRACTATSGPGLSLMAEAIGLAAMTETPLVIINTQRGGPSTGLPTKNEQSDLMAAIYNTHGDCAKIVLAPTSIEEAFYDSFEAFNLAEIYQCPVILLTDLQLALAKQSVPAFDTSKLLLQHGKLLNAEALPPIHAPEYFNRYSLDTTDGISPRVLPGTPNGICLGTGLEHDEAGRPAEAKAMRIKQSNKRLTKLKTILANYPQPLLVQAPFAKADLLLIGFNGTRGTLEEIARTLNSEGLKVNLILPRLLAPFPTEALRPYIEGAAKTIVFEHNATGQLANLIRMNLPQLPPLISILQYNGDISYPEELILRIKEVL